MRLFELFYQTLRLAKEEAKRRGKKNAMEKGMGGRRWGKRSWKASFIYIWINCQQYRKLSRETKKKKEGRRDSGEQEGQGGRQGGRKKGPRRVNITVLCQANIRCWDTSTKSHRSFGREEDGAREKEWAKMRVCGNKQRHPVKSWEMESESMEHQTNSCCC